MDADDVDAPARAPLMYRPEIVRTRSRFFLIGADASADLIVDPLVFMLPTVRDFATNSRICAGIYASDTYISAGI